MLIFALTLQKQITMIFVPSESFKYATVENSLRYIVCTFPLRAYKQSPLVAEETKP